MRDLRAGVIGFGYTGRLHSSAYEKIGVRVIAVSDNDPAVLDAVPAHMGRFTDYRDMLASDLDLVSICTPTALHCRFTVDALTAGKHVLLEKPIATTVADAEEMIEAARQTGRRLLVGMTHRFYRKSGRPNPSSIMAVSARSSWLAIRSSSISDSSIPRSGTCSRNWPGAAQRFRRAST